MLAGLEENLRTKYLGDTPPGPNVLLALKSNLKGDEMKEAGWFLIAMGWFQASLDRINAEQWQGYLKALLDTWVQAAQERFDVYDQQKRQWDLQNEGRRFAQSPYSDLVLKQLSQERDRRRSASDDLLSRLGTARQLLDEAYQTLEEVTNRSDQQVRFFLPYAEIEGQVRDQHLVAFEDESGIYIHDGFIDFVRSQAGTSQSQLINRWTAALLGHAALEKALLKFEVDPDVSHALAEALERMLLGEPLPDPGLRPADSHLDTVIRAFFAGTAVPSQPVEPAVSSPAPPAPVKTRPSYYYPGDSSVAKFEQAWRGWIKTHVDHGEHRLWDDEGVAEGFPSAADLSQQPGEELSFSSMRSYGQQARKQHHPHYMPLKHSVREPISTLESWITAYNELQPESPISHTAEELFQTYTDAADLIAADQTKKISPAGRWGRLINFLNTSFDKVGGRLQTPLRSNPAWRR